MKRILFAAILLGTTTLVNANETNFSYTTLGVEVGSTTLTPSTPICVGASCISNVNFTNFGLSGSYQFNGDLDWLVLSLGSEAGVTSLYGIDLTVSVGSLGINFVKAISDTVDIGGGVASLSSTVKACIGSTCVSEEDTGVGYIIGGEAWLNDAKNVSASIAVNRSKYSKDTTSTNGYGLGLDYYATKNHAVSASYSHSSSDGNSASSVMLGYAYHF